MDETVIGLGWQVRLPDGWEHNGSVSPAILTPPDNSSVVVITTSRIDGGLTEKDLRHLVRDLVSDGHEPEKVEVGGFHGLTFDTLRMKSTIGIGSLAVKEDCLRFFMTAKFPLRANMMRASIQSLHHWKLMSIRSN